MLKKFPALYLLAIVGTTIVIPAQAGVQRAFVASYGLNSNTSFNCDIAHPCRQFLAAVTVVNPDGEVVALDTAAYGAVTLTQSISLTAAPGAYAGITAFTGANGVTIATPGVNVVLRGLTINSQGGDAGILMTAGAKLSIENCVISNFSISGSQFNQKGVLVQTAATVRMVNTLVRDSDIGIQLEAGASANISGSKFIGNTYGIFAFNSLNGTVTTAAIYDTMVAQGVIGIYAFAFASTATARIEIVRSIISNYNEGVRVESQDGNLASASIRKSMVTESGLYGLSQSGNSSTMTSYGSNTLTNNFSNFNGIHLTASPQ